MTGFNAADGRIRPPGAALSCTVGKGNAAGNFVRPLSR
jgi:hypothetical protein